MSQASVSATAQQEFSDADHRIVAKADQSKKIAFDVSGVTTNTTRIWTAPDKDGTVAMTSDIVSGLTVDSQQPTSDVNNVTSTGFSGSKVVNVNFAFTWTNGLAKTIDFEARVSGGTWRTLFTITTLADGTSSFYGFAEISNFNVATEKLFFSDWNTNASVLDDSNAIQSATFVLANSSMGYVSYKEIWDEIRINVTDGTTGIEGSTADQRGRWYVAGTA